MGVPFHIKKKPHTLPRCLMKAILRIQLLLKCYIQVKEWLSGTQVKHPRKQLLGSMNLAVSVVEISEYQGWGGKDNPLGLVDTFLIDIFVFSCFYLFDGIDWE